MPSYPEQRERCVIVLVVSTLYLSFSFSLVSSYIKKFPSQIEIEKMKQEDDWDTLDLGAIEELEKKDNELRSILVKRENLH